MVNPTWIDGDDGARIASYDFGGDGPPLLLAHATGFHAHVWKPVVDRLTDMFRCYAFDERGHGASPAPPQRDFDWRRFGADARAVAAHFEMDRPFVAGHSAGGALLLLAEEDHPGTWGPIWTFEPVVPDARQNGGTDGGDNPLAAGARRRRAHFDSHDDAFANYASKPPFGRFDPDALRAYVDYGFVPDPAGGVTLACRPEDEAATYEAGAASRAWDRLPGVLVPVHVAHGEDSTHFPASMMKAIVDRLPSATLEGFAGVGHFGPLEAPGAMADSIRASFG